MGFRDMRDESSRSVSFIRSLLFSLYSTVVPTRLNNQIIMLMSDLGIPNSTFLDLQKKWFMDQPQALFNTQWIVWMLLSIDDNIHIWIEMSWKIDYRYQQMNVDIFLAVHWSRKLHPDNVSYVIEFWTSTDYLRNRHSFEQSLDQ